jgi:hypothetical protein
MAAVGKPIYPKPITEIVSNDIISSFNLFYKIYFKQIKEERETS